MIDHLRFMTRTRPAGLDRDAAQWAVNEIERLRNFHNAWVNAEVSHATGNPDVVKEKRERLLALHRTIHAGQE